MASIQSMAFSPDGERLIVANSLGTATVWDTKTGKFNAQFQAAEGQIDRIQFNPDGRSILVDPSTFTPGGVSIWDSRTFQKRLSLVAGKIPGLNVEIGDAEYSVDGNHIIGRFVDIGYVFKSDTGEKVQELFPKFTQLVSPSKEGSNIVIADSQLTEMDPRTGMRKVMLADTGNKSKITQVCISSNKDLVCLIGRERSFVSSLTRDAIEYEIPEIDGEWNEAMFSPNGNRLVTSITSYTFGGKGGHPLCELRDTSNGRSVKKFDYFNLGAFAPDSKTLVLIPAFYVSWNNSAYVANAENGEILFTLEGHSSRIREAQFSIDGRTIWTSSDDGTIAAWNAKSGSMLLRLASFIDKDWVSVTGDGYFDGSSNAIQYLRPIERDRSFANAVFSGRFRRPDIVANRLTLKSEPSPPPSPQVWSPPNKPPTTIPPITTPPQAIPPTAPPPNANPNIADTNRNNSGPRLVVLTIGVSEHEDEKLTLRYPHSDATEIAEALKKQGGRAFASVVTKSIINSEATVSGIRNGLKWLQEQCVENDCAFVLFSGHGGQSVDGLYYVPYRREVHVGGSQGFAWRELASYRGRCPS